MRWVITRVLPLPGPARMSTGPLIVSTASRWAGLSSESISIRYNYSISGRGVSSRGGKRAELPGVRKAAGLIIIAIFLFWELR